MKNLSFIVENMKISDEKLGDKLLNLYREQRKYTYLTLEGRKPSNHLMFNLLGDEIQLVSEEIGRRAKTRIRKECRERGIPYPDFKRWKTI